MIVLRFNTHDRATVFLLVDMCLCRAHSTAFNFLGNLVVDGCFTLLYNDSQTSSMSCVRTPT